MISQSNNRVQAIKSKFENLNNENVPLLKRESQLYQHGRTTSDKEREIFNQKLSPKDNSVFDSSVDDLSPKPNASYLSSKSDVRRTISESKSVLSRQTSDPGKKLHRSHAFRCDRNQIGSPKRHGSCKGRAESADYSNMNKKLSEDRLKLLGNFLETHMKKDNFVPSNVVAGEVQEIRDSIPDDQVPKHILDQYAKVSKNRKEEKLDAMTDSGVSSETENVDDEKSNKIKKLMSQFEKPDNEQKSNLESMDDLAASSETMRLERKNPHVVLTDTLKKALKQPLPAGPPPQKPPRSLASSSIDSVNKDKEEAKRKLEKLGKVLEKRSIVNHSQNVYDIAEEDLSDKKPKEVHYLCTEIINITQKTLLTNDNSDPLSCFKSLNCAVGSTLSLPYSRLSGDHSERNPVKRCSCSAENMSGTNKLTTFLADKCPKCLVNSEKHDGFKCHLNCKCTDKKSEFFVEKEHIYDEPCTESAVKKNHYGTINSLKQNILSRSLEDLKSPKNEDQIYEVPFDAQPESPETNSESPIIDTEVPKIDFKKLRQSFESGLVSDKPVAEKPLKPILVTKIKAAKSIESLFEDGLYAKKNDDRIYHTEKKRFRNRCGPNIGFTLPKIKKENAQLDVDRENLNRLMNEIYETVTAACNMDDNKPGSFPTEQSDSTSEESVKLTRSLTEKRKNYVRRVSSRVAYLEPQNIKTTRFRHQTSICSYRSDIIENPYSTFRSWKSFRTSQSNLNNKMDTDSKFNLTDSRGNILSMKDEFDSSIDNLSIDMKTGCLGIDLPQGARERGLFNVCLLVGLNYMTGEAYVKSVFPNQVQVPPHIENLVFPETLSSASKGEWAAEAHGSQCYSLVLTDERGERSYGYCRRVLPEGATVCLPLCYCLIGRYRAPGFYYKVLQEIESHHGSSETEIHSILQQLFETDFPEPGEEITITSTKNLIKHGSLQTIFSSSQISILSQSNNNLNTDKSVNSDTVNGDKVVNSDSVNGDKSVKSDKVVYNDKMISNDKDFNDLMKCKTMPNVRDTERCVLVRSESERNATENDKMADYYDFENNNGPKRVMLTFDGARTKVIKRPIEPRVDEDNLSVLLDLLGAGLVIKIFGSLLLERKVIIIGDKLSPVSSCLEALQSSLCPFVWQQPLISCIPAEIQRDVLDAPLPILAGMLKTSADLDLSGVIFEEGMLLDLTHLPTKVLFYQGDESTILPTASYKNLKTSLQMESNKHKDRQEDTKTRNVMISEAFMRFFVDILGDFWRFFHRGELKDGDLGKEDVIFDKESFIKSATSKQNQYFLEWFTETAMFNHFIQNMALIHKNKQTNIHTHEASLVDTPLPSFYELFEDRVKSRNKSNVSKNLDKGYKTAVNKRVRMLKNKLRELVA